MLWYTDVCWHWHLLNIPNIHINDCSIACFSGQTCTLKNYVKLSQLQNSTFKLRHFGFDPHVCKQSQCLDWWQKFKQMKSFNVLNYTKKAMASFSPLYFHSQSSDFIAQDNKAEMSEDHLTIDLSSGVVLLTALIFKPLITDL